MKGDFRRSDGVDEVYPWRAKEYLRDDDATSEVSSEKKAPDLNLVLGNVCQGCELRF